MKCSIWGLQAPERDTAVALEPLGADPQILWEPAGAGPMAAREPVAMGMETPDTAGPLEVKAVHLELLEEELDDA